MTATTAERPRLELSTFADRAALDAALASRLVRACVEGVARERAAVMLTGGTTPLAAYAAVARRVHKAREDLHLLYSDERHVPLAASGSNYGSTVPLLEALAVPGERVLHVRTELAPPAAAEDYEARLRALFSAGIGIGLALLGLGADGHTCSLFSDGDLRRAEGRLATWVHRPDGRDAITVTPSLLARVAEPLLVVAGAEKRQALTALLQRHPHLTAYRAFARCERVEVWADAASCQAQERLQP